MSLSTSEQEQWSRRTSDLDRTCLSESSSSAFGCMGTTLFSCTLKCWVCLVQPIQVQDRPGTALAVSTYIKPYLQLHKNLKHGGLEQLLEAHNFSGAVQDFA